MEKIDSFKVDHTRLLPGLYVSRVDKVGKETVTTFDLRMFRPNSGVFMEPKAAHTIEHIVATYLRNDQEFAEKVVYFGPMGCMTGFYLVVKGACGYIDVIQPLMRAFGTVAAWDWDEEIPGLSKKECGNFMFHSLPKAKEYAQDYQDVLFGIWRHDLVDRTEYPKPKMLVLCAMEEELDKFSRATPRFIRDEYDAAYALTGIGKVNAASAAQKAIQEINPDIVLNYGLCGALKDHGYEIGMGVSIDGTSYYDVWHGNGNRYGQVQGLPFCFGLRRLNRVQIEDFLNAGLCTSVLCKTESEAALPVNDYILTGDKFVDNSIYYEEIFPNFCFDTNDHYALIDMETAAIAQVCYQNDVPLIAFKVVSDFINLYESASEHESSYESFKDTFVK